MAYTLCKPIVNLSLFSSIPRPRNRKVIRSSTIICSHSSMGKRWKVVDFPYVSTPHRNLMVDLLSTIYDGLGSQILPSSVPPDVAYFANGERKAEGAMDIRSGEQDSLVDFTLESWLHCELPSGALNICNILVYLSTATDAPHLLVEFTQSSPTSLVLLIDSLPRRACSLHPGYIDHYYQDTQLDKQRQELEKVPEVSTYFCESLYFRSILSPTAISMSIKCDEPKRLEEIMQDHVHPISKEVVKIWLDNCESRGRRVDSSDKIALSEKDTLLKSKSFEIDLASNLPSLFGQEIASRVLGTIEKTFSIHS